MDLVLHDLSRHCTCSSDLRHFAINGLGMKSYIVNKHITNNDITSAAYRLLREWLHTQADCTTAHENLSKALTAAGMELHKEVILSLSIFEFTYRL